ncbi:nuclear transport factor 2 family protein [Sphingomonas sp. MMS24-J13]|uniref:nuclear transport factor 2 family protein n=1 Tax=Sphingomonas sp. MMS24-J13 TaxID=3238686 RepID=UPI003850E762
MRGGKTVLAIAPLLLASAAHAAPPCDARVRAVDAQFRAAMIHGDAKALDRIVADDAKIIHGNHGGIQDKAGLIDRFRSYHIDAYDRTPLLCRVSGDLAVLVASTRKVAGQAVTETSTTEVLVRRAGQWRILVLQNTDRTPG